MKLRSKSTPAFQCLPNPKQGHAGYGVSVWKCPRKSNAKYPHPPVYLPEIPSSNSRFAAQQPRAVIFICAGRTPAESPAKSISNATRMRSSHETLKMQMAALARKYFLHRINGRSERRLYHPFAPARTLPEAERA
jgi:hypothetical protein